MDDLIEFVEKNYADCFSVNLDHYIIRNFETRFFLFYFLEYKDNVLYFKTPFKKISVNVDSIKYFSVFDDYPTRLYCLTVTMITNNLSIVCYSSSKIGFDNLILNLLKKGIPQITYSSAYAYIKKYKLKQFNMQ